ncbi:MAG: hypothetical protein ACREV3_12860 [Gammaproteobacteria bacterium]
MDYICHGMQTVAETPEYLHQAKGLLTEGQREQIIHSWRVDRRLAC